MKDEYVFATRSLNSGIKIKFVKFKFLTKKVPTFNLLKDVWNNIFVLLVRGYGIGVVGGGEWVPLVGEGGGTVDI